MEWTPAGFAEEGFVGFVPLLTVDHLRLPEKPGVYVVFRTDPGKPVFLDRSVAGPHKGKDLTVPVARLADVWTPGASVLYIGKAGGPDSGATIRGRVKG